MMGIRPLLQINVIITPLFMDTQGNFPAQHTNACSEENILAESKGRLVLVHRPSFQRNHSKRLNHDVSRSNIVRKYRNNNIISVIKR